MATPSAGSPSAETIWLLPEDFEYLCFNFTRQQLSFNEPIPDYSTRDNGLLESALGSPRQTFGNTLLYPTLSKQASILFYLLIKNHPFRNGNKRIATISLLAFLALNKKWLSFSTQKLYKIACTISKSRPTDKDTLLIQLDNEIIKHLITFPDLPY